MNESNVVIVLRATCSGRLRGKDGDGGRDYVMKSQMDHALKYVHFILKDKAQEDFIRGRDIIKFVF